MRFNKVKCNLCGENESKKLATCRVEKADTSLPINDITIVKCSNCGLVFVNPHPEYSLEEFRRLYSEEYFSAPYMRFYIEKKANNPMNHLGYGLIGLRSLRKKAEY